MIVKQFPKQYQQQQQQQQQQVHHVSFLVGTHTIPCPMKGDDVIIMVDIMH
jgi:hypothetical protein